MYHLEPMDLVPLLPYSPFLRTVAESDDSETPEWGIVTDAFPEFTPELLEQLLAYCQGGSITYTIPFLRIAAYLCLPDLHRRIDADARQYGNQEHLQVVVDAGIGYDATWKDKYPVDATGLTREDIAGRGLYYLRPQMLMESWARYGWLDAIQ